jgi:MFS transporter, MCT family, solute carrier family 16 (monocarboxylic acid transporters), member 3
MGRDEFCDGAVTTGDAEKAIQSPIESQTDSSEVEASQGILRIVSANIPEEDVPPDGGWVAWSQVVAGHIATVMTWGYGTGFAVFQLYYKQHTDWSTSQISWIGSTQLFLYFVLGSISGRMADAGYTRHLDLVGSAVAVFGIFMTSLAKNYWQTFLSQAICTGVGGGLMFMPAVATVGTYFKRRRVMALSINACGSSTGAIVFPSIVQYLLPTIGFPWAIRVCGFVALFLAISGNLLLKPRKLPRRRSPLFDWQAFNDLPFSIFSAAVFLVFFAVFTLLIYVSLVRLKNMGIVLKVVSRSTLTLTWCSG